MNYASYKNLQIQITFIKRTQYFIFRYLVYGSTILKVNISNIFLTMLCIMTIIFITILFFGKYFYWNIIEYKW
jgi:hypothetical protein